jgi:hypothetical protein
VGAFLESKQLMQSRVKIPELRIVVNHCLGYNFDGKTPQQDWINAVEKLAENKNVTCKISGLYQRSVPQPAPQSIEHYQAVLEVLWKNFGRTPDLRKQLARYKAHGQLCQLRPIGGQIYQRKRPKAREHYYWKNAASAYRLPLK